MIWCGVAFKLLAFAAASPVARRQIYTPGAEQDGGPLDSLRQGVLQDLALRSEPQQNEMDDYLDELSDEELRQLLSQHLGGDRNGVLETLFGDDPDDVELEDRRRGPESYFDLKFEKRARDRPQFDPGWRFVGLGKRRHQNVLQQRTLAAERHDGDAPGDEVNPYLSFLVLSNLSDFFQELKHEIRGTPESSAAASPSATVPRVVPVVKAGGSPVLGTSASGDGVSFLYTRARKPEGQWKFKPKTVYDPGWMLTGLGK